MLRDDINLEVTTLKAFEHNSFQKISFHLDQKLEFHACQSDRDYFSNQLFSTFPHYSLSSEWIPADLFFFLF